MYALAFTVTGTRLQIYSIWNRTNAPLKGCAVPKLKFESSHRRLAAVCEEHFVMIVGDSVNQPRQPREQAEGAHQTALCDGRA